MTPSRDSRYAAAVQDLVPQVRPTVIPGQVREMVQAISPLTGSRGIDVPLCTEADVEYAVSLAHEAQPAWAASGVEHRKDVLLRFHDLVWRDQNSLLDLIQWENGKARRDAFEEIADVAMTTHYYAKTAAKTLATTRVAGAIPVLTSTMVRRSAKGVVSVIAPWNYPFTLVASDAIAALIAGNAIIMKPDRLTPVTALAIAELMWEAGVPRNVFQVVTGAGGTLGGPMISSSDFLMFTGSKRTGRTVAAQAGEALISVSAELGGKNPMIIRADAPLHRAVPGAVKACFSNTGQLCISIERIFVHEDIWDQFVPAFTDAVSKIPVTVEMDWQKSVGPLASQQQLETVTRHVDDAVAKGATVLAGGVALPDVAPTAFAPTVLTDVPPDAICYSQETFGPVVSLFKVSSDQEAIARANDTAYGLNASVWTKNTREGRVIAAQIRCGTVNVNEGYIAAWSSQAAPMGGMGISGIGRRHGPEGILKYTESQTIATQRLMNIAAPSGVSEKAWATFMKSYLTLRRRLGL